MGLKVKSQLRSSWLYSSVGCGVPECWVEMKNNSKALGG